FMASHLYDAGRHEEALGVCERLAPRIAEGVDADDFDVRMELSNFHFSFGEMLRGADRGGDALVQYGHALEYNPSHLPSLEAVGPLHTAAEEWKAAERVYRQLLQLTGGHGDRERVAGTYTELGIVERALGNGSKAYKRFNKALELHPNHVGALKGMALILEDRADWSNLLNIYNNIIYHATHPQDVIDAYMTKGRILDDHMARPDKAAQHYQRSLDFDANQPRAYLRLAELAMRRDDFASASRLAENGLRLEESKVVAVRGLLLAVVAAARRDAGNDADAARLVTQARESESRLVDTVAPDASAVDIAAAVRSLLPH
ncbi:MAG: tetratricopeptide (TPR) repeat protein, partial [Myxococcota bacterium]